MDLARRVAGGKKIGIDLMHFHEERTLGILGRKIMEQSTRSNRPTKRVGSRRV